jgi:hypothetical protein
VGAGAVVGRYALVLPGETDPFTGKVAADSYVGRCLDVADTSASMGLVVAAAWDDDDPDVVTLTLHAAGTPLLDTRVAVEAAHHVYIDRDEDAPGPVVTAAGRVADLELRPGFVPVPLWVELTAPGTPAGRLQIWVINRPGHTGEQAMNLT